MNSIECGIVIGIIFAVVGVTIPDRIIGILGGDEEIIAVGSGYTRIFMSFAPFFICNHICNAFVRNDSRPGLAMLATLLSSLFNIYLITFLCFRADLE